MTGASGMAALGNSLDETIGIISSVVTEMPNQASRAIRGIQSYGNAIAKLANDSGELSYKVDGVTKSISLLDSTTGDIKSTFAVLSEINKDWNKMSNAEKQALGLALAGKNQFAVFEASLNSFDVALDATEKALGSTGSALKENARYLDSIQGKVSQFTSELVCGWCEAGGRAD